jgi:hypothetical protein
MNHHDNAWARMFARLTKAWLEFLQEVRESRYVPEGVDDPQWRRTIAQAAVPVRAKRMIEEAKYLADMTTDSLPVIALNEDGSLLVTSTTPKPAKAKRHSPDFRASLRMHAAETRFNAKVDNIVAEAMLELGLDPSEVLHMWAQSLGEELAGLRTWQG